MFDQRDIELAWIAGFFEGEGSIHWHKSNFSWREQESDKSKRSFLMLSATQVIREPLDRMQAVLGGKVYGPYGPYNNHPEKKPIFRWQLAGAKAETAIDLILSQLSPRRIEQLKEVRRKVEENVW